MAVNSFSKLEKQKHILPVIIFAQFFCTSLWFAGNAVLSDLVIKFSIEAQSLGYLISAVQLGFICGALVFAILCVADRFSPSKVFFACALLAAVSNLGILWEGNRLISLLGFRFLTGFFLAGIYPVGMKIAADYYKDGLGRSLGYLVGALVLGTALPHLLKDFPEVLNCDAVIKTTSFLAILGGLLMNLLVPNGPYRKSGSRPDFSAFFTVFKNKRFRAAAFGYFGHMWELYAFWAFVPIVLSTYQGLHQDSSFSIPFVSFLIIGIGALSCVRGGYLAVNYGSKKIAFVSLALSCLCCICSPLLFMIESEMMFLIILLFWGMVVIADSPLFSTLVAQNSNPENKGTGLTIVTCVGFGITILSIQLLNGFYAAGYARWMLMLLAIGPILGLLSLRETRA